MSISNDVVYESCHPHGFVNHTLNEVLSCPNGIYFQLNYEISCENAYLIVRLPAGNEVAASEKLCGSFDGALESYTWPVVDTGPSLSFFLVDNVETRDYGYYMRFGCLEEEVLSTSSELRIVFQ